MLDYIFFFAGGVVTGFVGGAFFGARLVAGYMTEQGQHWRASDEAIHRALSGKSR